jgi:hypothetical protein
MRLSDGSVVVSGLHGHRDADNLPLNFSASISSLVRRPARCVDTRG